ncbi:hypothetical protein RRG08_005331, partial [Elysia crispata]
AHAKSGIQAVKTCMPDHSPGVMAHAKLSICLRIKLCKADFISQSMGPRQRVCLRVKLVPADFISFA